MSLYIGLMSGTSMDGIDAALVDLPSNKLECGITKKYSDELRKRIDDLVGGNSLSLASICQLNTLIGREFALAVNELLQETNVSPGAIKAIGSHGQTVCHDTKCAIPYTLQLGCGHTISSLTGITVVADFRTRDIVNGGQGAPFAPLYHQELFSHCDSEIALVNIGGISNVTFINPHQPTRGWDVGPGNCLMDAWIMRQLHKSYDAGGAWAKQGTVIEPLLTQLLADPFFSWSAPKSIGKEYFSLSWLEQYVNSEYKPVDIQATLLALTVRSIASTIISNQGAIKHVYLCGGGTHNTHLLNALADLLPHIKVCSIAETGASPDYLEAMMFAWLASQTLDNIPVNLTSITGAKELALLGAVYPILK
ncbi:anhydro-N-acetylmuramic acid kinase [Legionella bononiensis]|uniref:Anhydro-N-acetylmuramic acid kinase n=1 Tax=Legionella bononiensis TaxID=2793102 RepID=A0ABS1WBA5_9GAMM|nr:anhydro-N-acetylmuramic acid kinase [Legionella bononiensis]MBL7480934.1 anhydro-N-acetylmuramic acid kinase [Legionella bononiensis]MBL7526642.1 anhydro-N-acetylmuramic acid kinase [Legionella bononiensis]MBL7564049.1 anhydro-N-acetylmuramic acid kinase [Legionella bononiensis]